MTRYLATIAHPSILRARVIEAGETLTQAKRAASREFGDEFLQYTIQVYDRDGYEPDVSIAYLPCVAARKVGASKWNNR